MKSASKARAHVRDAVHAVLLGAVIGCSSSLDAPTNRASQRAEFSRPSPRPVVGHLPMLDELLEEVNDRAPGFGGMYWSGSGELTVYLTAGGSQPTVEKAVREVFSDLPWHRVASVRFRTARFEVRELQFWRNRVPEVVKGASLIWTDLDEVANVIRVGVEEGTDVAAVARQLRGSGAPDGAILLEHSKRPLLTQYLTSTHRPTVGGVQIELRSSTLAQLYGWCTLGFNARISTDEPHSYFVTNSHCTGTRYALDGARAMQPDSATSPTEIGFEVADPPLQSGLSGCPVGDKCRYSDAALFRYWSNAYSNFAYLAKTASFSSTMGVNGSLFRVDSFHVVADIPESYLLAADTLNPDTWMHKVGRTTGWTFGAVVRTCVRWTTQGGWLLCQYSVSAQSDLGDSGSPAFWWMCCGLNEAWLGGILWGLIPGYYYTFSSITGIKNDLGPNLLSY